MASNPVIRFLMAGVTLELRGKNLLVHERKARRVWRVPASWQSLSASKICKAVAGRFEALRRLHQAEQVPSFGHALLRLSAADISEEAVDAMSDALVRLLVSDALAELGFIEVDNKQNREGEIEDARERKK